MKKYNLQKAPKPEESKIAEKIMTALLWAYIIPAALTSPFTLYALAYGATKYYFRKRDFDREVRRLQKRGYVALTKTDQGWLVKLLDKGKQKAKEIEFHNLKLRRDKQWDGIWRMFIFDIPEEIRSKRNAIRRKLKALGMFNVQRSTFIYPYDCRRELELAAGYYNVSKYAIFAEVTSIDIQKELKKHFSL